MISDMSALLTKLYTCLDQKDYAGMSECYHPKATFHDIAFSLCGKLHIQAMWHMISETDLRATFRILKVDGGRGVVDLTDRYTFTDTGYFIHNEIRSTFQFRDELIIEHRDVCNRFLWAIQSSGPFKGTFAYFFPSLIRRKGKKKLEDFIARHPEYDSRVEPGSSRPAVH